MEMKEIIKYVAIAGAVYLVYTYVIAPMMTPTVASAAPPATPTTPATSAGIVNNPPAACPPGYTGVYPNCTAPVAAGGGGSTGVVDNTFTSSDFGTANWIARVSSAMATAAGGTGTQNFDNWSYYYQNSAGGSPISPNLMQNIINAGGGQRGMQITAPAFLGFLVSAGSANGLSGLSEIVYTGSGLGSFWRM